MRCHRGSIFSLFLFVAFLGVSGCSDDQSSVSIGPSLSSEQRGLALDPRTNPLRTYIRDTWVNSSTTATGGSHYPHIKIFGFCHSNLAGYQDDADFIAEHFDAYMWGGPIVGAASASLNPDMLWMHEAGNIPCIRTGYDSTRVADWIGNPATCMHGNPRPGNNAQGYGWDDLLLLYKYNTSTWVSTKRGLSYFPGWNPADDTDGDGCIEPGEGNNGQPSDSNRSAQDYFDARVRVWLGAGKYWMLGDVTSPGYIALKASDAIYEYDTWDVEGFHFDEAAFEPQSLGLTNTFKYEGLTENAYDFVYQEHKKSLVPAVMEIVEDHIGYPVVAFANMVKPFYACELTAQKEAALEYLENSFLEVWIKTTGGSGSSLANTSKRAAILETPYLEYLSADEGMFFGALDESNSERGKLFTLGMFYLINHQMGFYYYRISNHVGQDAETNQWNPWVAYDVGQPMVNNLSLNDFQGNSGTNKFFVFASGSTYQILGRQFQRSDGKKILVLVKLMTDGQTEGSGSASHALGASYRRLQSDFTWSSQSNSVTLTNNSAVILTKYIPECQECIPEG